MAWLQCVGSRYGCRGEAPDTQWVFRRARLPCRGRHRARGGGLSVAVAPLHLLLSPSPPLSLPLSLSSLSSLSPPPPLLSNGGTGATLGEMPDGGVVEGLGLPVISPSEGVLGVPVVLSDPGMGETVEGPLVSHAKSGGGGAGEETTQRAKGGEKTVEAPPKPFLLSEGLPPVPAKLVGRIWKGEFIDMAKLLRDNLEAQRRGGWQEMPSSSASGLSRQRREVPDLLSWVQCFGVYTAVVASQYPERVQKLLAYQTLMVREARRCGGKGWLSYDSYFRQQMVGEWRGDEWGRLNPYLFSSTFLALGGAHRPNCSLCLESDHHEDECALARANPVSAVAPKHLPQSPRDLVRDSGSRASKGKASRSTVCFQWNQGECVYPYCKFRHICVRCGGDHRIIHCRSLGSQPAMVDRRGAREREGPTRQNQ